MKTVIFVHIRLSHASTCMVPFSNGACLTWKGPVEKDKNCPCMCNKNQLDFDNVEHRNANITPSDYDLPFCTGISEDGALKCSFLKTRISDLAIYM